MVRLGVGPMSGKVIRHGIELDLNRVKPRLNCAKAGLHTGEPYLNTSETLVQSIDIGF